MRRLYRVPWALWFFILLVRVANVPPILWRTQMPSLLIFGRVVPGLLFAGAIWIANGFSPDLSRSRKESPSGP